MTTPTGQDVRLARKARSWTQQQLADAAGVDRATISRIENETFSDPRSLGPVLAALSLGEYAEITAEGRARSLPNAQIAADLVRRLAALDEALARIEELESQLDGFLGDPKSAPEGIAEPAQPGRHTRLDPAG